MIAWKYKPEAVEWQLSLSNRNVSLSLSKADFRRRVGKTIAHLSLCLPWLITLLLCNSAY
jgi:hypothetical protein